MAGFFFAPVAGRSASAAAFARGDLGPVDLDALAVSLLDQLQPGRVDGEGIGLVADLHFALEWLVELRRHGFTLCCRGNCLPKIAPAAPRGMKAPAPGWPRRGRARPGTAAICRGRCSCASGGRAVRPAAGT